MQNHAKFCRTMQISADISTTICITMPNFASKTASLFSQCINSLSQTFGLKLTLIISLLTIDISGAVNCSLKVCFSGWDEGEVGS